MSLEITSEKEQIMREFIKSLTGDDLINLLLLYLDENESRQKKTFKKVEKFFDKHEEF